MEEKAMKYGKILLCTVLSIAAYNFVQSRYPESLPALMNLGKKAA